MCHRLPEPPSGVCRVGTQAKITPEPDAHVVAKSVDIVESRSSETESLPASPLDPYRSSTALDRSYASLMTPQMNDQFGGLLLTENGQPFGVNDFKAGGFDLNSVNDRQAMALASTFHTTPEKVNQLLQEAKLLQELTSKDTITPAEQQARCDAANSECMAAIGNINTGSANAGDLASLLASYSTLNGFTKGSFAQSYVNDAITKVRSVLGAATENNAHPSGLSYAQVVAMRLTSDRVDRLDNTPRV